MLTEDQFRNKVTYYSFFTILGVVFIHAYNVEVYRLNKGSAGIERFVYWFETYCRTLQNICVPFFFMLSGYLFFRTFKWDKILYKYISRLHTVVIPYFLWCSLYYVYFICVTNAPYLVNAIGNIERVEFNFTTYFSWLWVDEYYVFWFLKELILMILLTPVIYILFQNFRKVKVGGAVLFILFLMEMGVFPVKFLPLNFYYVVGAYIGINHKEWPLIRERKITLISMVLMISLLIYIAFLMLNGKEISSFLILVSCICLWNGFNFLNYDWEPYWWMKASFFIYCLHDLFLEVFEKIFLILFGMNPVCALIDYVAMPFITVIVVISVAKILKGHCIPLWNLLTGNRG